MPQKKAVIESFLQAIKAHAEAAKENQESFSKLAEDVEGFPRKVESALSAADSVPTVSSGFSGKVWEWIRKVKEWAVKLWTTIWQMIEGLFTKLVSILTTALARLRRISFRFSPWGPSIHFDFVPGGAPRGHQKKDNYTALHDKLAGFESVWQLIHVKCSTLTANLEFAQTFPEMSEPQSVDILLEEAATAVLDDPLIECLHAYYRGEVLA
ncbi:hypothetical protein DICSQDRAFT_166070 [Dichomitus squalens LYAD-421 SS1]|uniref:uncharacterized protein n=1 Tax=Dichomitus squalens (strain LYAD-421) TaxID=732165 RepID=UPI00044152CF|nr:uncharacterized protein DICSQDRAFT_166070 [Dichomitus squalens LYAD-421 SS1]EJF65008.1 hypothetical protein DICSQDRAFT_166070 [Dichomitus squalens LYAD-421 SS1]